MQYNQNCNLTGTQKLNRFLFSPPEDSLSSHGFDQIHHYESQKITKYHLGYSATMTRVHALAMPLFALLDAIYFSCALLFKAVILDKNGVKYALWNVAKAVKLFLVLIPAWIPSMIAPTLLLRSDAAWREIQKGQTLKKMDFTPEDFKDPQELKKWFEESLHRQIGNYIYSEEIKTLFNDCVQELVLSLPADPDKVEVVIANYLRLSATFLVQAANNNIDFNEKKCFFLLFKELVQIRDPDAREEFLVHVLDHYDSWEELIKKLGAASEEGKTSYLFTFLTRQLTNEEEALAQLNNLWKHSYLSGSPVNRRNFCSLLLKMHKLSFSESEKSLLLQKITALMTPPKEKTSVKKKQSIIQAKQKKLREKQERLTKSQTELSALENSSPAYKAKALQCTQLEENIASLLAEISSISVESDASDSTSAHVGKGLQNLSILLQLPSKEMIFEILNKIGNAEKTYSFLSDSKIIADLMIRIFDLKEESLDLTELLKCRSPEALLKFHLRLLQYKGSDKKLILNKNKMIFLSILKGNYWASRFSEDENPHLMKVFAGRKDLKEKWMAQPKPSKVSDLVSHPSPTFKDYEISLATDPTDVLLIGDDLGTCVNLEGRLNRLMGLLGFIADGKTHTLLAKASPDAPSSAETQLQLLWDSENQQPVLFLEQVNYKGSEKKDATLESAVIAYAKRMAEDLGISLVSCYANHDKRIPHLGHSYKGSVVSLGSSSPIEYVNSKFAITKGVYSIGSCREMVVKTKTTPLFSCAQWPKCNGSSRLVEARKTVTRLQQQTIPAVSFNPKKLKGKVDGGNCTALAFHFATKVFDQYPREGSLSQLAKKINEWKLLYQTGEAEDILLMRSIQEAFNTITVEKQPDIDLSKNKIEAMARFHNFTVEEASPEFSIPKGKQSKALKLIKGLSDGIHFLRIIKPLDNEKQEDFGHSLVFIKKQNEAIFYDPSDTVEHIESTYLGDRMFFHLQRCFKRWNVQNARFYKLAEIAETT